MVGNRAAYECDSDGEGADPVVLHSHRHAVLAMVWDVPFSIPWQHTSSAITCLGRARGYWSE